MNFGLLCSSSSWHPWNCKFLPQISFLSRRMNSKAHTLSNSIPNSKFPASPHNDDRDASSTDALTSDPYEKKASSLSATVSFGLKRRMRVDLRPHLGQRSDDGAEEFGTSSHLSLPIEDFMSQDDDGSSLPTSFGKKRAKYRGTSPKRNQKYSNSNSFGNTDSEEGLQKVEPFDICPSNIRNSYKSLLHQWNKEIEMDNFVEKTEEILRPGMVLLKNYVSLNDQMVIDFNTVLAIISQCITDRDLWKINRPRVFNWLTNQSWCRDWMTLVKQISLRINNDLQVQIVQKCRELGLGPGGFYQPGYQDGAKLRLQMMCLGHNWDPQTKYEERQSNGSDAPDIPPELTLLVKKALQDSHALIKEQDEASNVEDILPGMSPDICIVNFYTTSGRLGLHQDRDESQESLRKGLPVVSLSLGDSAEFLYGDKRDCPLKVLLESGDILIFGGKSRHVFHGVKSIITRSAPPLFLKETMLRPGRLNLTFRQF